MNSHQSPFCSYSVSAASVLMHSSTSADREEEPGNKIVVVLLTCMLVFMASEKAGGEHEGEKERERNWLVQTHLHQIIH